MDMIVCLDDQLGISFLGKRQSMDRVVYADIANRYASNILWMETCSVKLFSEHELDIRVFEKDPDVGSNDAIFAESDFLLDFTDRADRIIAYRWNRLYPSDVRFPAEKLSCFRLTESVDLAGYSHDCITLEVYAREKNFL